MTRRRRDRGQLVLVAAGLAAVALLACLLAYLQLAGGTAPPREPAPAGTVDGVVRGLEEAVGNASAAVTGEHSDRPRAARALDRTLSPDVRAVTATAAASGSAVIVHGNGTAARAWARESCPGGTDRAFEECVVRDAAVFQTRAGVVHVVAVAFDVAVDDGRRRARLTVVVRPVRGAVTGG